MDTVSSMSICILLVDNDRASSVRESLLLRLSKYQVVTADNGKEALHILRTTQHTFNLVLAAINLPDISTFEFLKKVEEETRLPVVTICDDYDQSTITRALMGGAMLCLLKPLKFNEIKNLWQIPVLKHRRAMVKSLRFPKMGNLGVMRRNVVLKSNGLGISSIPRNELLMHERYQKRKADELERTNGWSVGESSSGWTPDVKHKLQKIVEGLPRFYSAPQVVARRNYALGISNALVVEKQQQSESRRPCTDALSATSSNPPSPMDQRANKCVRYKEESVLKRYLENHHSREQLRRLVVVSLGKWDAFPKALSVAPPPPSPPSEVPPISVPLALAAYIENFIHTTMAVVRAPPGFMNEVASNVASTGPSVLTEFQGCNEELEPGFLEELDTDELFDAIEELRD